MKRFCLTKLLFCLLLHYLIVCNCEDLNITIWENENRELSKSFLNIRVMQQTLDKDTLKGQTLLPMCSMVGCATNATQCVAHGGKEMVNKMSVGDFTQAYFKSVFTLDKTFLSINCNKLLVPCCFPKTLDNGKPSAPSFTFLPSLPFKMPSFPQLPSLPSLPALPSFPSMSVKPGFIRELVSMMPEVPPVSVYILSNICGGLSGGVGDISCNEDE